MMRNIPTASAEAAEAIAVRHQRVDHLLRIRRSVPRDASTLLGGLPAEERLPLWKEQDRKTIEGISTLKRFGHLLDGTALRYNPHEDAADDWGADAIIALYEQSGFASEHPHVMASCKRTRAYAELIAEALQNHIEKPRLPPGSFGAVGMMRNVSAFFGDRGYHRKQLVARHTWKELGVHEAYLNALRPVSVDSGPLRKIEYRALQEQPAVIAMHIAKRRKQIDAAFNKNFDAIWMEFAGFMGSIADDDGLPKSFEEIVAHARRTRNDQESYETFVDQQSLFLASRYSTDTLSPELEDVWLNIYRQCFDRLEAFGVDMEKIRQDVIQRMV